MASAIDIKKLRSLKKDLQIKQACAVEGTAVYLLLSDFIVDLDSTRRDLQREMGLEPTQE